MTWVSCLSGPAAAGGAGGRWVSAPYPATGPAMTLIATWVTEWPCLLEISMVTTELYHGVVGSTSPWASDWVPRGCVGGPAPIADTVHPHTVARHFKS